MPTGTAARQAQTLPTGLNDVLDKLTLAHAENFDRHGPIVGIESVKAPADAVAFAVQQEQLAAAIDAAADPSAKSAALLAKEAHQHEQIGRLATYVAGYEIAHGDPGHAAPMRELGRDHLQLADQLRQTIAQEADTGTLQEIERRGLVPEAQQVADLSDLMPADARAEVTQINRQRDRSNSGRSL